MTEQLYKYLNIILDFNTQSPYFLSCTNTQWQAYVQQLSSLDVMALNWWSLVFTNSLSWNRFLFVSIDLFLYGAIIILLVQFGLLYHKHSAQTLLTISGDTTRRFVSVSLLFLCFQSFYFLFSVPTPDLDWTSRVSYLHGLYFVDYFTQLVKLFMFIIWLGLYRFLDALAISHSQGIAEFPILSHLVLCFSLTMISAGDFALLLICLEGFSLILYIMATIGRLHGGITAAAKYFAFGTAGSVLILWGAVHIYEATGSMSFRAVFYVFEYLTEHTPNSLLLSKLEWAAAAVLIGFLVKLGAAPTHQWVPDVYSGVPLFVTAFYAIFVKFVLYMLFLRLTYQFSASAELEYTAALSLLVGCFGTLRQVEIKRFLAYGSITHMGFLLTGDLPASMVYLAAYVLASFVFFSVLLNLRINGQEFVYLSDLRYVGASASQWDRLLLVLALASMAGLPPFAGFYGKMLIWASLLEDIYLFNDFTSYFLLVLNLSVSLVIIFYYMRLIILIYLGGEADQMTTISSYLYTFWYVGAPSWKTYRLSATNSQQYIAYRQMDIRGTQYVSVFLLTFWTFFTPLVLTFATVLSEVISNPLV